MKRLLLRFINPSLINILDYAASYPSRWPDGGVPVETFRDKFGEEYLDQLVEEGYLTTKDESTGIDR